MATPNPYFLYPWAAAAGPSDVTPIDNTGGTTGPLSYQYGFTPNYEEDLSTVPSALPVPRSQFNQLMLDVTTALQQLQLQGAPLFVLPSAGGPASYPIYARVSYTAGAPYGLQIWESQVNGNTSVPGADNNWIIISGGRGNAAGTYIDSASPRGYPGALLCNGASYVRTTYPLLFQALTYTATCTLNSTVTVTVPSDVIALVSAYMPNTGTSTGGNLQACYVEGTGITNGTYITAVGTTTITLSAAASTSGSVTLTFLPYGYGASGINAANFGVPNCSRTVNVASGGSGNNYLRNKLANRGGADTYTMVLSDLADHTHNVAVPVVAGAIKGFGFAQGTLYSYNATATTGVNNRGTQTAMNIIQSSNVVFRYVKY